MELTDENITELYKFTRQHYVEHYDVQTELVDHLANDIEQIVKKEPSLSFREARDRSFKKFGVFGFMEVVEKKQKVMNKRYWKIVYRFLKDWFILPKIITTACLFLFFFILLKIPYSNYLMMAFFLLLASYDFIKTAQLRKKHKINIEKKKKMFLLEAMIFETRNTFTTITFINLINIVNLTKIDFNALNNYWLVLIATFVTLLSIASYITAVIIPQKAKELLTETYPVYKFV